MTATAHSLKKRGARRNDGQAPATRTGNAGAAKSATDFQRMKDTLTEIRREQRRKTLPEGAPGRNGYRYRPSYGVIILCADEPDQQAVYERLKRAGYTLKGVTV